MSEQGRDEFHEPLSKRQKCGDGDGKKAAEIIAFGGPMYDEATAHKKLKEVEYSGVEMVIGFETDDATLDNAYDVHGGTTPMIHFAGEGNAKMCRYLISRGASTTKAGEHDFGIFFPMYSAARNGHLDVCKILYENGAKDDIRRMTGDWSPFRVAAFYGYDQVVRWLVLHGALCADNNSEEVEVDRIPNELRGVVFSCNDLVAWAKEVTQTQSSVVTFLLGALPPEPGEDQTRTLQCLSVHPGIRKHIGDFAGLEVIKRKHLRILRNVVEVLPPLLKR